MIKRVNQTSGQLRNPQEVTQPLRQLSLVQSDPNLRRRPNSEGKLFQKLMEILIILQQKSRRKREGSDQKRVNQIAGQLPRY